MGSRTQDVGLGFGGWGVHETQTTWTADRRGIGKMKCSGSFCFQQMRDVNQLTGSGCCGGSENKDG